MITALFWLGWLVAMASVKSDNMPTRAFVCWMGWSLAMFVVAVAGTVLVNR